VHGKVLVDARDAQGAMRLDAGCREHEGAVRQLPASLDQNAQRRRVDEVDVSEIDDESFGLLRREVEQRRAYDRRVVEVELPGQTDDDRAVRAVDSFHRMLVEDLSGRFVHRSD
jgi:hypothetical protein